MKKLSLVFISLFLLAFAGSALAAKNPKTIRHCGCYYDTIGATASMIFHDVTVAGKSQGHRNHVATANTLEFAEECFDGIVEDLPTYEFWTRTEPDCMVDGTNEGLDACVAQEEFAVCGSEVPAD